jgi:hypothetical protein
VADRADSIQMNILNRITKQIRQSATSDDEAHTLDYVPVEAVDDWRMVRLAQAAQRHGKPFKCASDALPREVLVGGKHRIAVASGSDDLSSV